MKYNSKLTAKYAKGVPGEQTRLCGINDVLKEEEFTEYSALDRHPPGMPVSAYRNQAGELKIVQRNGLCHTLVSGSTGCGKSMRYLENFLYNLNGNVSVIVADVKGELFKNTSEYLKTVYGEENVKFMDYVHPETSQILFNPVAQLARKYLEAELYPEQKQYIRNEVLADLKKLYDKLFPIRTSKDISWDQGARGFIYGMTVALFEDMFLTREDERRTGRKRVLPEQINFEALSEVFVRFECGSEFNDKGFFESRSNDSLVWRYVRGIINDAPNTRACYIQLVESYLADYTYPDIRSLTICDNFKVETLAEKPQVIFLTYDLSDKRMRGFVNQYVVEALDTLKNISINSNKPLKIPVQFVLDEFPTLQADEIYPTIFSIGRGVKIFITAIVQDYTQLETSYSNGVAQQIRNNCNLNFFLGTNDINTAKAVKEQIGRHIIPDPANYLQGGIKFVETYLVSEDELMHRIKPGEVYVTMNSHMPLKGMFELYFDCPEYLAYPRASGVREPVINFKAPELHYDASWMTDTPRYRRF